MALGQAIASFEDLRSLAFGSISGTYAAVGTATTHRVRSFCITNATQGGMIFSLDSTNANGHMFVPANTAKLYDVQSNMNTNADDSYVFPIGTQFYVKQVTAPISGAVYIECLK